jgi:hypothetical protein
MVYQIVGRNSGTDTKVQNQESIFQRAAVHLEREEKTPKCVEAKIERQAKHINMVDIVVQRMEDPSNKKTPETTNLEGKETETTRAFRLEGKPKSEKSISGAQKLASSEAVKRVIERSETLLENVKNQLMLENVKNQLIADWEEIQKAKEKQKEKTKNRSAKNKLYKQQQVKAEEIYQQLEEQEANLKIGIESGEFIPTRLQINGSHLLEAKKGIGKITGVSPCDFNFSVGTPIHSEYFATTGGNEGKWIQIEFGLKKEAWRKWKTEMSGPQVSGLGPSASNKVMTLNDVTKPGVKYEVKKNVLNTFFKEVIDQGKEVIITPLETKKNIISESIAIEILRLKRSIEKLAMALDGLILAESVEKEEQQLKVGKNIFDIVGKKEKHSEEELEELYKAISLTKNALHSMRRKTMPNKK